MNEFIITGISLTGIILYVIITLFIGFTYEDTNFIPNILIFFIIHTLFTIICLFFILGGIPYIIMGWLIIYFIMLLYAIYLHFKK